MNAGNSTLLNMLLSMNHGETRLESFLLFTACDAAGSSFLRRHAKSFYESLKENAIDLLPYKDVVDRRLKELHGAKSRKWTPKQTHVVLGRLRTEGKVIASWTCCRR